VNGNAPLLPSTAARPLKSAAIDCDRWSRALIGRQVQGAADSTLETNRSINESIVNKIFVFDTLSQIRFIYLADLRDRLSECSFMIISDSIDRDTASRASLFHRYLYHPGFVSRGFIVSAY